MIIFDHIVVGSGCAGSIAAKTLVNAGDKVLMLDVGVSSKLSVPDKDFLFLRKHDEDQYKYFLGSNGEGIAQDTASKGAQVTPPRRHITELTDQLIPIDSETFSPVESLGYGGLGIGWGLQCWEYSDQELAKTGLNSGQIVKAYDEVARIIGISASRDYAADHTLGSLKSFMPAAHMDDNHKLIYKRYTDRLSYFKSKGLIVGRTPLALLTRDLGSRKAYKYQDMDFYTNNGESAWRPSVTVNQLKKYKNFLYVKSMLVISFEEQKSATVVRAIDVDSKKQHLFYCKNLILASGALGTARIVLRSLGSDNQATSVLSNPHTYVTCLQPSLLGAGVKANMLSLGQLSYFIDKNSSEDLSVASSYSYQSLMLFRIINLAPLNFVDARKLLQYMLPAMVIMIVQHPDSVSGSKTLKLVKDTATLTGDKLKAEYLLSAREENMWLEREKEYKSFMRKLGLFHIKTLHPKHGSAIHYAGTLPFNSKSRALSIDPTGRINNTRSVYVADSSGFNHLPAKGLTFTLMANALVTANKVLLKK